MLPKATVMGLRVLELFKPSHMGMQCLVQLTTTHSRTMWSNKVHSCLFTILIIGGLTWYRGIQKCTVVRRTLGRPIVVIAARQD